MAIQNAAGDLEAVPALKNLNVNPVVVLLVTATDIEPNAPAVDVEFNPTTTFGVEAKVNGKVTDTSVYPFAATLVDATLPLQILFNG